jgi:hypothetical protein
MLAQQTAGHLDSATFCVGMRLSRGVTKGAMLCGVFGCAEFGGLNTSIPHREQASATNKTSPVAAVFLVMSFVCAWVPDLQGHRTL